MLAPLIYTYFNWLEAYDLPCIDEWIIYEFLPIFIADVFDERECNTYTVKIQGNISGSSMEFSKGNLFNKTLIKSTLFCIRIYVYILQSQ